MTTLAEAGDTWGVSGPEFLGIYAVLAIAALLMAVGWRAWTVRAPGRPAPADLCPSSPPELALLSSDGKSRALAASVIGLWAAYALDAGPGGTVAASGPLPATAGDLDRAVHAAAATPRRLRDLLRDPEVRAALRRMSRELTGRGLLAARWRARLGTLPLLAVAALGIARVIAGLANDKPVNYLIDATLATLAAAAACVAVPRIAPGGRTAFASARSRNAHLNPVQSPSWVTYGAATVSIGVALYGTAALWQASPAFAADAGFPMLTADPTWASGGGGYSSGDTGVGYGGGCSGGGGGGCGG
jgi:uncharacterized protein (TIGR04222 family)